MTNGVYATGGRAVGTNLLANRVTVDKPLTLQSVNGSLFTLIQGAKAPGGGNGDGAVRCVYLADGASLSGFTLTNGATLWDYEVSVQAANRGGGVWCASTNAALTNCVMVGNSACHCGGASGATLDKCMLTVTLSIRILGLTTAGRGPACPVVWEPGQSLPATRLRNLVPSRYQLLNCSRSQRDANYRKVHEQQ